MLRPYQVMDTLNHNWKKNEKWHWQVQTSSMLRPYQVTDALNHIWKKKKKKWEVALTGTGVGSSVLFAANRPPALNILDSGKSLKYLKNILGVSL